MTDVVFERQTEIGIAPAVRRHTVCLVVDHHAVVRCHALELDAQRMVFAVGEAAAVDQYRVTLIADRQMQVVAVTVTAAQRTVGEHGEACVLVPAAAQGVHTAVLAVVVQGLRCGGGQGCVALCGGYAEDIQALGVKLVQTDKAEGRIVKQQGGTAENVACADAVAVAEGLDLARGHELSGQCLGQRVHLLFDHRRAGLEVQTHVVHGLHAVVEYLDMVHGGLFPVHAVGVDLNGELQGHFIERQLIERVGQEVRTQEGQNGYDGTGLDAAPVAGLVLGQVVFLEVLHLRKHAVRDAGQLVLGQHVQHGQVGQRLHPVHHANAGVQRAGGRLGHDGRMGCNPV